MADADPSGHHLAEAIRAVSTPVAADWAARLASGLGAADVHELRSRCADVAWIARDAREPIPDLPATPTLAAVYYVAQRLRFDFNFARLRTLLRRPDVRVHDDALLAALSAFAEFGLRNPEVGRQRLALATGSADADVKSDHVALHALWFASHDRDMAELLALSERMLHRYGEDANLRFRRASALRRLHRFDEAVVEIDDAIDLLGASDPLIHQDFVRERELIVASQITSSVALAAVNDVKEAKQQIDRRLERAERLVGESLFRTVEILGVFLALTTFVFGTASAAIQARSTPELLGSMALLLVGTAGFLLMMRLIITSGRR